MARVTFEESIDQIVRAFSDELLSSVEDVDINDIEEWQHESPDYMLSDVIGIVGRLDASLSDQNRENVRLHCQEAAVALLKISYIYGAL